MAKNEFAKMTPEERSKWGKIGAEKSIEVRRKRKETNRSKSTMLIIFSLFPR